MVLWFDSKVLILRLLRAPSAVQADEVVQVLVIVPECLTFYNALFLCSYLSLTLILRTEGAMLERHFGTLLPTLHPCLFLLLPYLCL